MAMPGKMGTQGALSAYSSAPPCSIRPHAGVGSCTPSPRYESEASRRIAWPTKVVSMIRYGAITFGAMCLRMMRRSEKPQARAAST